MVTSETPRKPLKLTDPELRRITLALTISLKNCAGPLKIDVDINFALWRDIDPWLQYCPAVS